MLKELFHRVARNVAHAIGTPHAFVLALGLVVVWALSGPIFGYSDTWQLIINTSTTVITFLVVFLIQNTQNHDSRALHLKLDELLRAVNNARNSLVDLEELPDEELAKLEAEFRRLKGNVGQGKAPEPAEAAPERDQSFRRNPGEEDSPRNSKVTGDGSNPGRVGGWRRGWGGPRSQSWPPASVVRGLPAI